MKRYVIISLALCFLVASSHYGRSPVVSVSQVVQSNVSQRQGHAALKNSPQVKSVIRGQCVIPSQIDHYGVYLNNGVGKVGTMIRISRFTSSHYTLSSATKIHVKFFGMTVYKEVSTDRSSGGVHSGVLQAVNFSHQDSHAHHNKHYKLAPGNVDFPTLLLKIRQALINNATSIHLRFQGKADTKHIYDRVISLHNLKRANVLVPGLPGKSVSAVQIPIVNSKGQTLQLYFARDLNYKLVMISTHRFNFSIAMKWEGGQPLAGDCLHHTSTST